MDIETITKLLDAGYTKAEIDAMAAPAESDQGGEGSGKANQTTTEKPGNDGAKNEGEVNKEQTDAGAEFAAALKTLTDTVTGLKDTVAKMQNANINNARQTGTTTDPVMSVIDSFINSL